MAHTEIRPSPDGVHMYDLWVDGEKEMHGESLAIVEATRDSLSGIASGAYSEAAEVADAMLKARGGNSNGPV